MKKALAFLAGGVSFLCIFVLLLLLVSKLGPINVLVTGLFIIGGIAGLVAYRDIVEG